MKIRQFIVWLNIPLPSGKASFPPRFHKLESYSQEYPFVKTLKAQLWNLYPCIEYSFPKPGKVTGTLEHSLAVPHRTGTGTGGTIPVFCSFPAVARFSAAVVFNKKN
jgi:hypothetical protein